MHFQIAIGTLSLWYVSATADTKQKAKDLELHFLPNRGAPSSGHGPHHKRPHESDHNQHGNGAVLPLSEFSKMFPFDLPPGGHVRVIHLNPLGPGGGGDDILNSILAELSSSFHDDMKPLLAHSQSEGRNALHPCADDVEKFCGHDHGHSHEHLSNLHCLGLHSSDISQKCANEIQLSLPFVCSVAISEFCSIQDTLDKSVLDCLEDAHTNKETKNLLSQACADSITATRSIISRMKNQDMALVDRRTGRILKSTAVFVSRTVYIVFVLGALIILGLVLYGIWSRDDETSVVKSVQSTVRNMIGWAKSGSVGSDPRAVEMRFNKAGQNDRSL